jgi:hypothetical protein
VTIFPSGRFSVISQTQLQGSPRRNRHCGSSRRFEGAFAARLRKGVEDGDLPPDTDVDAMAAYYNAVALGLAVQARDGAPRERLAEIGRIAMRAWPTTSRKNAIKCRGE